MNGIMNPQQATYQQQQRNQVMSSNGAYILGDNHRDFRKYLEIEKMSSNNNQLPQSNSKLHLYQPQDQQQHQPKRSETPNPQTQGTSPNQYPYPFNQPLPLNPKPFEANGDDLSFLFAEIKAIKNHLKSSFENQSEIQSKIIEYNKIIAEQENVIRLNNIKLNEHDSKLTEILLSFNNYLQLNDKSGKIVNEVQRQLGDCIRVNDFNELKSSLYTLNKNNENKINEMLHIHNDFKSKLEEVTKENESYQKFSLERIKTVQREAMDSRLQQQNDLIKMEESKEARLNAQIEQLKNMIKYIEGNLASEASFRKTMVDNLRNEVLSSLMRNDEKFAKLEKSQLETEKNLIYLNKDYMTAFQELITKQNEKNGIDLRALQSIIEAGLTKVDNKLDKDNRDYQESFNVLKASITEQRMSLSELEKFVKDTINSMETKVQLTKTNNENYITKFDFLSETLNKFMKENLELINQKNNDTISALETKINQSITDYKLLNQMENEPHAKKVIDLEEKLKEIIAFISSSSPNKAIDLNKRKEDEKGIGIENRSKTSDNRLFQDDPQVIKEYVESICNERLSPLQAAFESFEKKLLGILNMNIDDAKAKFSLEQNSTFEKINSMLENKIELLSDDLTKKLKEDRTIIDGRLLEYVGESENRIKKKYDEDIAKLKEDIDNLIVKFVSNQF